MKGAPHGIRHGKAVASFAEVEQARTLHEGGWRVKAIAKHFGRSINTIRDWIYFRTRNYG